VIARRAAVVLMLLARAAAASDDPIEPPADAAEGEDYVVESVDSLADGDVEMGLAAEGRAGGVIRQRRRVQLRDEDFDGAWREGPGDPLGGGSLRRTVAGGRVSVGRLSTRWGRGLAWGGSREPWRRTLEHGGGGEGESRAELVRPASGKGIAIERGGGVPVEALAGRIEKRGMAGARFRRGPLAAGTIVEHGAGTVGSLAFMTDLDQAEVAFDGHGRWSAELLHERAVGRAWVGTRVRGGSTAFRPAGGRRAVPPRSLAVEWQAPAGGFDVGALGALWRWNAGRAGGRLALEVRREMAHHARLALGFEEQHGSRRASGGRVTGVRQGLWGEWRAVSDPVALAVRHEVFGARSMARDAVRVASSLQLDAPLGFGWDARLVHTSYRVRRGESLYLPEPASDRVVLRALTGDGERTRIELRAPVAGGRVSAGLAWDDTRGRTTRPRWSVEWARRARTRRGAPSSETEETR
jgi:hypothetical protein